MPSSYYCVVALLSCVLQFGLPLLLEPPPTRRGQNHHRLHIGIHTEDRQDYAPLILSHVPVDLSSPLVDDGLQFVINDATSIYPGDRSYIFCANLLFEGQAVADVMLKTDLPTPTLRR
jgi:hypothetical protein